MIQVSSSEFEHWPQQRYFIHCDQGKEERQIIAMYFSFYSSAIIGIQNKHFESKREGRLFIKEVRENSYRKTRAEYFLTWDWSGPGIEPVSPALVGRIFFPRIFIYLAVLGLNRSTWDLHCGAQTLSFWCSGSVVVAHRLQSSRVQLSCSSMWES